MLNVRLTAGLAALLIVALSMPAAALGAADNPWFDPESVIWNERFETLLLPSLRRAWDTPRRVYWIPESAVDSARAHGGPYPFTYLLNVMSEADVVLIGEQHDDPATHDLQLDILQGLFFLQADRRSALALEMFERDVQGWLDAYLGGVADEADFLAYSRPWSNYATDYAPLIEWQLRFGVGAVVASNAPTPISRRVAREGLEAVLPTLSEEELGWIASETTAPHDEYWGRFYAAMGGGASDAAHGHHMSDDAIYRFYQAQCLKDDTMAETISRLREEDPERQVLHLSGSFHMDHGLGIVPRLRARRPHDRIVTVALRPVADIDAIDLTEYAGLADFVVFVPAPDADPEETPSVGAE